jgi:hypothetical protein
VITIPMSEGTDHPLPVRVWLNPPQDGDLDLNVEQWGSILWLDRPTAARLAELLGAFAATGKLPDGPPEGVA